MQFCRIYWTNTLNGFVGHGEWFPISREKFLREWLEQLSVTNPYIIHELQFIINDSQTDTVEKTGQTSE